MKFTIAITAAGLSAALVRANPVPNPSASVLYYGDIPLTYITKYETTGVAETAAPSAITKSEYPSVVLSSMSSPTTVRATHTWRPSLIHYGDLPLTYSTEHDTSTSSDLAALSSRTSAPGSTSALASTSSPVSTPSPKTSVAVLHYGGIALTYSTVTAATTGA